MKRAAVLLFIAVLVAGCWRGDGRAREGAAAPQEAELSAYVKAETLAYLAGPGTPLLAIRDSAIPLFSTAPEALAQACAVVIAGLPSGVDLTDLIADVPDRVLAERLLDEQSALLDALSSCRSGELEEAQAFLVETTQLRGPTDERLAAVRS